MKKRKGFTLIELMIVIAIIIILAAIAIPNYLRMTDRARRSRVAGDFASIATALEAYSVDWGKYPVATSLVSGVRVPFGKATVLNHFENEIIGTAAADLTVLNSPGNTTFTGEKGGIDYIKNETIQAMYNPFAPSTDYYYASTDTGTHWVLGVQYNTTDYLFRSDGTTDLTQRTGLVTALVITIAGVVTP